MKGLCKTCISSARGHSVHIEAVSSLEAGHELTCCASRILEAKVIDVWCLE